MEVGGLPLHPLVVHAVVGLVPLSALLGWALALLPGWRWLTRWAAVAAVLGAVGATFLARRSGASLMDTVAARAQGSPLLDQIHTHQERAGVLWWLVLVHALVVVVAFVLLPAPSGLADGRLHHRGNRAGWVRRVLPGALLATGVLVVVWVVLTGDAGARAVWGS